MVLEIGNVVFREAEGQLPPAPADTPVAVRMALLEAMATQPEVLIYTGNSFTRPIRFASGENRGWVDNAQKALLKALHAAHSRFTVRTDLLGIRGTPPVAYNDCFFDPTVTPIFPPHPVPTGDYWLFDMVIRMPST